MKTTLPLVLASLTLVLPVHGKQGTFAQDPVATAIQAASQAAQERSYGLTVSQSSSKAVAADSCYLLITLPAYNKIQGRLGQFGSINGQSPAAQEEEAAMLRQQRAAVAEALQPFGLELDQKTRVSQLGPVVNFSVYATLTLPITANGEVSFGKASPQQVRKALREVSADSNFIFNVSPQQGTETLKTLAEQAIKTGIDKAKTLASLAGSSTLRLVRLQESDSNSGTSVTYVWPLDGSVHAPKQTLSTTVTLYFAPLDVVLSTRK